MMKWPNSLHFSFYAILFILAFVGVCSETFQLPIFFPSERPYKEDLYLCTSVSLNASSLYIQSFTPVAEMSVVHHMLLYGCITPGGRNRDKLWACGGMMMTSTSYTTSLPVADICAVGSPKILYAWARNAPKLELPENVAFQVGGNTGIMSLVLQFHAGDHAGMSMPMSRHKKSTNNELVDVGLILGASTTSTSKLAGVYLLASGGSIPAHSRINLEIACKYTEDIEICPFAFRTHSHSLGKVISGYRVRKDTNGRFNWTLIGKMNPQLPQMFYPVENKGMVIQKNDILAARCIMESDRPTITEIGMTAKEEMCNFYIMYYTKQGRPLRHDVCFSTSPDAGNFWRRSPFRLSNIPEDASSLI